MTGRIVLWLTLLAIFMFGWIERRGTLAVIGITGMMIVAWWLVIEEDLE